MTTKSIPNYHLIKNLLNICNFNTKEKNNSYIEGKLTLQNEIDDIKDFLHNDYILHFQSKMKWVNTLYYHNSPVLSLSVLNNDSLISCSEDSTINIYHSSNFKLKYTLKGHTKGISYIASTNKGDKIISSSLDNTIKVWQLYDEEPFFKCEHTLIGHTDYVNKVIWINDSNIMSISKDKTIKIWKGFVPYDHISTIQAHDENIKDIILLKNGNVISCSDDKKLIMWDIVIEQEEIKINNKLIIEEVYCNGNNCMKETNEGKIIVAGFETIYLINLESGIIETEIRSVGIITSVLYANDYTLWCGHTEGCLYQYNLNVLKCIGKKSKMHKGDVNSIVMIGDNVVTCSEDNTIKVWKYQ